MTTPASPKHWMTPEYKAALDRVARNLYSLDIHFCRWEDASEEKRAAYRQKAHLARVWWDLHYQTEKETHNSGDHRNEHSQEGLQDPEGTQEGQER